MFMPQNSSSTTARFVLLVFLFHASICQAKYSSLELAQLLDKAQVIGIGEIIHVGEKHLAVRFSEFLKGKPKVKILIIRKFEDWECASRWMPYKIGQTELFFLEYSKNRELAILGSGNEGEMPIVNQRLYYKSPNQYMDKHAKAYQLSEGEINGYSFTLAEARAGISTYLSNQKVFHEMAKSKTLRNVLLENRFLSRLVFELRY
jgi:hypothetical protein